MLLNQIKLTKTNLGKSQMTSGDAYRITLTYKGHRCGFTFHDNFKNSSTKEEIIESLLIDADAYNNARNFEDFCFEFGYDVSDSEAYKIYTACKKQADKVSRLFTNAEIEQLRSEIFED